MTEEGPKPEVKKIDYETVVAALREKGWSDPEAKELFIAWLAQEEAVAEEANGGRANVVVSLEEAVVFAEAGLKEEARVAYQEALFQAQHEGETDIEAMIEEELRKLERNSYEEEDVRREAKAAQQERLRHLPDASLKEEEMRLDDDALVARFLNNFHGHLPGGYKRASKEGQLERDIDAAIERLGLNRETIIHWESEQPQDKEEKKKQLDVLLVLYIEMRRLGYHHYPELTS